MDLKGFLKDVIKKKEFILTIVLTFIIASLLTIGVQKLMQGGLFSDSIYILSDKRCQDCNAEVLADSMKKRFPKLDVEIIDYNDSDGKSIYENEKLDKLPVIIMPKSIQSNPSFSRISRFAKPGKDYLVLSARGKFDPKGEICDNQIDDDKNGLVDCSDPVCKTAWQCMEKLDKPEVELFVMSHCPFGVQIEKGFLPVVEALGDKINFNIRFCDYLMHGEKEKDEELRQHCIQQQDKAKFIKYLKCFVEDGNSDKCVGEAGINQAQLNGCVSSTDGRYGVTRNFKNKSTFKGRFPTFAVNADLVKKYGVSGSPTLIINKTKVQVGRSPKNLLYASCMGFKEQPKECKLELSTETPASGFKKGATSPGKGDGNCGGAR